MKAGIDFGTSLVKAVWMKDGEYGFASTADRTLEDIAMELHDDGVQRIHVAGVGYSDEHARNLNQFTLKTIKGDPIRHEKKTQVYGVKKLLEHNGERRRNFFLVSVGTGTSYTVRLPGVTIPIPLGNSLGGGFLAGTGRLVGIDDYGEMARMASRGTPLNIYVKDKVPTLNGTALGEYVLAHFGLATQDSVPEDVMATAIDIASATTVKDIAVVSHSSLLFRWTKDVIYTGSTIARFPSLRNSLETYTRMLGKTPHFPEHGEFALAVGAYHMQE